MSATVAISRTLEKHRSKQRVLALVREALDALGGMPQFVKPGQTVLIKPNQTVFYSAEEGCTTDPLIVGALIRLAKLAGAARVQVAESSGGFFSSLECMRITGMAVIAEREGAELIDLGSDSVPNRTVRIPSVRVIQEVPLPAPLLDADVIIDVPKAKNHHIEPITGALKNWVGAVNQNWRNHNGDQDTTGRFMGDRRRWRTMPWMVLMFFMLVVPLGITSIVLVMLQPVAVGAWCTLCLTTAALMLIMIPLAVDEVVAMGQFWCRSGGMESPSGRTSGAAERWKERRRTPGLRIFTRHSDECSLRWFGERQCP